MNVELLPATVFVGACLGGATWAWRALNSRLRQAQTAADERMLELMARLASERQATHRKLAHVQQVQDKHARDIRLVLERTSAEPKKEDVPELVLPKKQVVAPVPQQAVKSETDIQTARDRAFMDTEPIGLDARLGAAQVWH